MQQLIENALRGRAYRFRREDSEDPWSEGVLVKKYRDDDGVLRGEFRYFEGSPRLPEGPDLLEMKPIDFS